MDEHEQRKPVEFKILPEGPLFVKGKFTVIDASGGKIEIENETYLCACGLSHKKPFCDCSHKLKLK